jgi:chemotaxis signal transduction protein
MEIIPMIDLRKSFCVNKNPQSIDYLYRVSNKMSIITKEISAEAAGMTFDNYSKIIEFHATATNKIRSNIYKFDRNYKLDWYFEPSVRSLKKRR